MNYNDKVMDVIDEVKKVVIGKDVCIAKIMGFRMMTFTK